MGKQYIDEFNVHVLKVDNYEELLEMMKPSGTLWGTTKNSIFRGQANSNWDLIPSLYRNNLKNCYTQLFSDLKENGCNREYYSYVEYTMLKFFYNNIKNIGLTVPYVPFFDDEYLNGNEVLSTWKMNGDLFEYEGIPELAALAQHYGIPTRLLDWTQDFFTALYFATSKMVEFIYNENVEQKKPLNIVDKYMVVWVMPTFTLLSNSSNIITPKMSLLTPSYSNNRNICAQKGILTHYKEPETSDFQSVNMFKFDKLIYDFYQKHPLKDMEFGVELYKILIPVFECTKIICHIDKLGYNRMTLLPWYNQVREYMNDKYMYEKIIMEFKELDWQSRYSHKNIESEELFV